MQALRNNQAGVAVIEFAFVLPFLLLLFLGGVEFTRYIQIHQKLDKTNNQLAGLAANIDPISTADLQAFIDSVPQLMEPYDADESSHIFSLIGREGDDPITVIDQFSAGGGSGVSRLGGIGSAVDLGPFTMQPDDEAIVSETYFIYEPLLGGLLEAIGFDLGQDTEGLYKRAVIRPRSGTIGGFN